jgi:hypothetical protein
VGWQPNVEPSVPHPRWGTEASPLNPGEAGTLPTWESFPLADRRLLIHLIVQAAQRQARGQAVGSHVAGGRPRHE